MLSRLLRTLGFFECAQFCLLARTRFYFKSRPDLRLTLSTGACFGLGFNTGGDQSSFVNCRYDRWRC